MKANGEKFVVARSACKLKKLPDKLFIRAEKSIRAAKEEVKQDDVIESRSPASTRSHQTRSSRSTSATSTE